MPGRQADPKTKTATVSAIASWIARSRGSRSRAVDKAGARILTAMAYPERIIPDETEPGVVALHFKRYEFALPYSAGRDVLDAGCGVGYGSALLAERARNVVGVDRSE